MRGRSSGTGWKYPLPLATSRLPLALVCCAGYSLIELLIAVLAGVVVVLATIQSFQHFQKRFLGQQTSMAQHQDLRIGLAVMGSELRLAGAGGHLVGPPLLKAEPEEVVFLANLGGYSTSLTAGVSATELELAVRNGSGWPKGKRVVVCRQDHCAEARLARNGRSQALSLSWPLGQAFPAGGHVFIVNEVRYYLGEDQQGNPRLMRAVDGGASSLIGDITVFELAYLGKDGMPTDNPARAARVLVNVAVGGSQRTVRHEVGLRV